MPGVSRRSRTSSENMSVFVLRRIDGAQSGGTILSDIRPGPRTITITLPAPTSDINYRTCSILRHHIMYSFGLCIFGGQPSILESLYSLIRDFLLSQINI
jgi:hypothetical protein